MNKRKRKRGIKRIRKIIDKWLKPLGLLWWHIEINYCLDRRDFQKPNGYETAARATTRWSYMRAEIDLNLECLAEQTDKHLEETLVHEFMHILINEMREDDPDLKHEERVCEQLAHAFLWVREADV